MRVGIQGLGVSKCRLMMRLAQQSLQHSHILWSCAIDGLCLIQIHSINDPIGTEEQNDVGDQSSPILKTQPRRPNNPNRQGEAASV